MLKGKSPDFVQTRWGQERLVQSMDNTGLFLANELPTEIPT